MQDWERFGEEIRRTVQDAVDSQNFDRLNQTITDTINQAIDGAAQGMRNFGDTIERNARRGRYRGDWHGRHGMGGFGGGQDGQAGMNGFGGDWGGEPGMGGFGGGYGGEPGMNGFGGGYGGEPGMGGFGGGQDGQPGMNGFGGSWSGRPAAVRRKEYQNKTLYKQVGSTKAAGVLLAVFGYGLGAAEFLLSLIIMLSMLVTADFSASLLVGFGFLALLLSASIVMAVSGTRKMLRVGRFRKYIGVLRGREYCDVKEIAEQLQLSQKYVAKDIEKLIRRGWFRQGHLDRQRSCLMVTNGAYEQYQKLEVQMEQRKREEEEQQEARRRAEAEKAAKMNNVDITPEIRDVLERGDAFIRKIHECNEAIPGEEISAKISRMEMVVDKIFDRVEQNPETVADIRRMMEYYLPTTVKLLEAYEEMDRQPAGGENIKTAKREIEATLDTLNTAFEKLLDDLFQDTAWDVSSDISVLHTMLAQEGLMEDELNKKS